MLRTLSVWAVKLSIVCLATGLLVASGCATARPADRPQPAQPSAAAPPAPAAPVAAEEPAEPAETPRSNVRVLMHEHFIITMLSRNAVIVGDLEAAREPANALADHRYAADLPAAWEESLDRLQDAARQAAVARDLPAAARGVAEMARVCGDCHLAASGKAELGDSSEPASGKTDSVEERMGRHILALDRMWIGLTGPSDDAWRDGAKVLVHAPAKTRGQELTPEFRAALREVRALGTRAERAAGSVQRAEVYGQLLSTCAGCHALRAAVEF